MTIQEYIKQIGTQTEAAHRIGVPHATLSRWLMGHNRPSPMMRRRLKSLGIEWEDVKEG